MANALNFGSYYAVWIMTILIASVGQPWLAAFVPAAWVLLQLEQAGFRGPEVRLVASALLVGLLADGVLVYLGFMSFDAAGSTPLPAWMTLLWAAFASTLRHSMRWILGRPWLAVLLGAIGGPIAYIGGQSFGAVSLDRDLLSIAAVAIEYAIAMPLLCRIAARDGVHAPSGRDGLLEGAR